MADAKDALKAIEERNKRQKNLDDLQEEEKERESRIHERQMQKKEKRKFGKNVLFKLLLIAFVSFIIGGLFTWVIAIAIEEMPVVKRFIGRDSYGDILFLVFIVGFVLSLVTSSYAFLSKEEISGEVYIKDFEKREQALWKEAMTSPARPIAKSTEPKPPKIPEMSEKQQAALIAAADKREALARKLEREELADELKHDDFTTSEESQTSDSVSVDQDDEPLVDPDDEPSVDPDDEPSVDPDDELPELSDHAEKQKVRLMTFLSRGLESVMMSRSKLDAFSKFGINLYLAGACDTLGQSENLEKEEIDTILVESVGVLGTSTTQAKKFAGSYEEYLMNPKYLEMIECGREAMISHAGGNNESAKKMESALEGWNKKRSNDSDMPTGTIAVMFTDIVGSTELTQTHGDIAAQEVVRTHNRIVRAALTTYHGKEVKHTGDGIMASFANTANGVSAAILIQQKISEDNANSPEFPLGVKIGINTGEPIVEDNDLFGTTVQLAARIVDKAGSNEIFVSETVKGICQGKSFQFTNRGTRELKGFKDPITIYQAMWKVDDSQAAYTEDQLAQTNPE